MIKDLEWIEDFRRLNLEVFVSLTYIICRMLVIPKEFIEKNERESIGRLQFEEYLSLLSINETK